MNRLNKTESAIFLLCRFSLFLKDLFFQTILSCCFLQMIVIFHKFYYFHLAARLVIFSMTLTTIYIPVNRLLLANVTLTSSSLIRLAPMIRVAQMARV